MRPHPGGSPCHQGATSGGRARAVPWRAGLARARWMRRAASCRGMHGLAVRGDRNTGMCTGGRSLTDPGVTRALARSARAPPAALHSTKTQARMPGLRARQTACVESVTVLLACLRRSHAGTAAAPCGAQRVRRATLGVCHSPPHAPPRAHGAADRRRLAPAAPALTPSRAAPSRPLRLLPVRDWRTPLPPTHAVCVTSAAGLRRPSRMCRHTLLATSNAPALGSRPDETNAAPGPGRLGVGQHTAPGERPPPNPRCTPVCDAARDDFTTPRPQSWQGRALLHVVWCAPPL